MDFVGVAPDPLGEAVTGVGAGGVGAAQINDETNEVTRDKSVGAPPPESDGARTGAVERDDEVLISRSD